MQGLIERSQPEYVLQIMTGARFSLLTLAALALWWTLSDIREYRRGERPLNHLLAYILRVLVAVACFAFQPAAFVRLDLLRFSPSIAAYLQIFGLFLMCLYFIGMQTVKLIHSGTSTKQAWLRTIPILLATVVLFVAGASLNVRS